MLYKKIYLTVLLGIFISIASGQSSLDSFNQNKWTHHFQMTVIAQKHSGFSSLYHGERSLADSVEPAAMSLTSTLFVGRKLWKGAAIYVNPELSGGKGLSFATGVAGALNGETYRVGTTEPQVFIARAYLQQVFSLGNTSYERNEDDFNQVADALPKKRLTITLGKFAISDFFDENNYGKDPRSQFLNWSLWANGAWDYPANTRGYNFGIVSEIKYPTWTFKLSSVAVPTTANGALMEYIFDKAHSETIEIAHSFTCNKRAAVVKVLLSNTHSKAPAFNDARNAFLQQGDYYLAEVVNGSEEGKNYTGTKTSIGFNYEQELANNIGFFSRIGWNDGKCASWAFTEIDRTISGGFLLNGTRWRRPLDNFGIATSINGISSDHRDYLNAGGYGFIIGDGKLNYGNEWIVETFYNTRVSDHFWLSFDYQFVKNPGYNKDRGPVHVFGIRSHFEF